MTDDVGGQNAKTPQEELARRNRNVILSVAVLVCAMAGLAYASVPLYNLFCRLTGFGGTTQVADNLPKDIIDRDMIVRFDTNTAQGMDWDFKPEQKSMTLKLGQRGIANFMAHNRAAAPSAGTALFNVTPLKAGKYFTKIQCFCFGEQILGAGETVHMPVLFFVDPKLHDDPAMDDVKVITLSYSFFKTESKELEEATEKFYESQ